MTDSKTANAARAWANMQVLVLDPRRRGKVADAVHLPFGRSRALRRVAAHDGITQRELGTLIGSDPAYTTVLVDDLAARGLVTREPHPTDRRSKIVRATSDGRLLAKEAERLLAEPPREFLDLSAQELALLASMLDRVAAAADAYSAKGTGPPTE